MTIKTCSILQGRIFLRQDVFFLRVIDCLIVFMKNDAYSSRNMEQEDKRMQGWKNGNCCWSGH